MTLLALGTLVALLLAGPALAAEVVRMGDLPAISNAGLYVAMEKGYFGDKSITVETERFASGAKMTPALATGQLDVAIGTPAASLFNAIASGMDFRIVADKGQVRPGFSFSPVIVRRDLVDGGRVKRVRDLKGLKLASGAKGIHLDYFLAKMLEHDGLSYDAVEIVTLAYPDAIRALASKAVDAVIAPEPWGVRAEEQKVGVRLFLTEQTPEIATFQAAVIMYSGKFIKDRPKVAREFLQAYAKGVRYYLERGPKNDEIATILSKHTSVPPETIKASIPFYIEPDVKPRVQDLATLQDWFHQMGWVKQKVPIDRVVDLSFLQ
ncbi:MAG TPA: ABC transporter substrate-binding protein [Candidatus Binatia bacterium]|nr:ABC transporter substrate-binding protein [Candidatus Binatia bacterium]